MIVTPIRTEPITAGSATLHEVLERYLPPLQERSVVVITSKIVSLCEGAVVPGTQEKAELVRQEAARYLPPEESAYGITLTVRDQILIPTAGIDESNGDGNFVLWPRDPWGTANRVRKFLEERCGLSEVAVIITDSTTAPMRRGTRGIALSYSGLKALNDYVGKPDIFGKEMRVTQANVADGLAAAAVVAMGEGDELLPLAVVTDCPFVQFTQEDPQPNEVAIPLEEDLYAPMLTKVDWRTGGAGR